MKKRILSLLLVIVMVAGMLPMPGHVHAAETAYPYAVVDTEAGTVTIDGTLGGKTEATEDDINGLVERLKEYVDNGITTMIVTGSEPAMYTAYSIPAYAEALYRLTEGNDQSSYCGTIDLILPNATEIVGSAFWDAFALNSITLPKVTKLGDNAFYHCRYLKKITFGSVLTEVEETVYRIFELAGENVGGCDLVLNCGQMDSPYIPNLNTGIWTFKHTNEFNSITLTHTGGEATCTVQAVCNDCGKSYGDLAAHTIENHECTLCGAMEIVVSFDAGDYEWKTGDQIRLTSKIVLTDYYFTAAVAEDGTVTWTPDKPLYWDGTGVHTLVAKYPKERAYDCFYVPADQSTPENLREADLINAVWSGNPTTDPITFNLKHRLAKVTVNYEVAEDVTISKAEVYTLTQYLFFDVDTLERRDFTWQEGDDLWINSYLNGTQFTAFVSPDDYAADGNFIKITLSDGTVYEVKMNKAVTFAEGAEYTYKVIITADGAYLVCADECTFEYTDNGNGTHKKACSVCGYEVANEAHTPDANGYTVGTDGTHSFTCVCNATVTEAHSFADGTCDCGAEGFTYDEATNTYTVYQGTAMQPAFDAAGESGTTDNPATIKLAASMEVAGTPDEYDIVNQDILVDKGVITLDLNGHTITSTGEAYYVIYVDNGAELTIDDSSEGKQGKIKTVHAAVHPYNGKLVINGGTFEGDVYAVCGWDNNSSIEINGGTFISTKFAIDAQSSVLSITGGTFTGGYTALSLNTRGTASVTGGSFSGGEYDIDTGGVKGFLSYNEETGVGPTFPGGLSIWTSESTGRNLNALLADGAAYYDANGEKIELDDRAASYDGDVTVECSHTGGTATCNAKAKCDKCGREYGKEDLSNHDTENAEYENGFCLSCEAYEPAKLVDGVYEIESAGQLFWFAQQVNNDIHNTDGDGNKDFITASAILTADIDLENRVWTPIGALYSTTDTVGNHFAGTFDGNHKTITGLNVQATTPDSGFFGEIRGATVKNFTIHGTITVMANGLSNIGTIGAVCGQTGTLITGESTVSGITSYVDIVLGEGVSFTKLEHIGGIAGYTNQKPTIENCVWDGTINIGTVNATNVGGIVGLIRDNSTTIRNCGTYGTITSGGSWGGILGNAQAGTSTIENCFTTASNVCGTVNGYVTVNNSFNGTEYSAAPAGQIAYKLGAAWGQNLSTDSFPILGGAPVYQVTVCDKPAYSNTNENVAHSFDDNGFCHAIDGETHYKPANLNAEGVYEIANAGNLFWFAQHVNAGNGAANAVMTKDIDLGGRAWTPIANYAGLFDGGNYSITNLSVDASASNAGLFGALSGTVQDLTVSGSITVTANDVHKVAVIGELRDGGTVSGIVSYVDITVSSGITGTAYIGGVVGELWGGTVSASVYHGQIALGAASVDQTGGIVGYVQYGGGAPTITNCGFYGSISATNTGNSIGGILGYSRKSSLTLTNCLSVGTLPASGSNVTAFGTLNAAPQSISGLYYLEGSAPNATANSGDYSYTPPAGAITAAPLDQLKSGEIAYNLGEAWGQTIGTDRYPVLGGEKVYFDENADPQYYNEKAVILSVILSKGTTAQYTVDGQTVTVTHDKPCAVGYLDKASGKYIAITAVADQAGNYRFTAPKGVTEVLIALKGDVNQDGRITASDIARTNAHIQGKTTLTAEELFAADVNGDGQVSNDDIQYLNLAILGMSGSSITW